MGKHNEHDWRGRARRGMKGRPRTGSGFGSKVQPVVKKSEIKQRDEKGNVLFELTRKLWRK